MRTTLAIVVILTVAVLAAPTFAQDDYRRANTGYGVPLGSAWLAGGGSTMMPADATTGIVTDGTAVTSGGCKSCNRCSTCGSGNYGLTCPAGPYRQTCLRCQPHCCDSAWDGYCEEKQRKLEWWSKFGYKESPVIVIPKIGLRGCLTGCCKLGSRGRATHCVAQPACNASVRAINQTITTAPVAPGPQINLLLTGDSMPEAIPAAPEAADTPDLAPPSS